MFVVIIIVVVVVVKLNINLFKFSQEVYTEEEFSDTMERLNYHSQVHPFNVYGSKLKLAKQKLIQKPYMGQSIQERTK